MNRYKLGFSLGRQEHHFRYWGIKLLVLGFAILFGGYYYWNRWAIFISLIIIGLSTMCEVISLLFHFAEKRAMNGQRHRK